MSRVLPGGYKPRLVEPGMAKALPPDLAILLKQTSRTFHKTLIVLPAAIRFQISLAYLLARTTDSIADTEIVPVQQRLRALQQLRERILGEHDTILDITTLADRQGDLAERELLANCDRSLAELQELSADDLQCVREVLKTIISGQELDLQRFADASSAGIIALQNDAELDDYTHRVAGCVGEFWTKMCRAHLFPRAKLEETRFLSDAIRFGKGLQLVNILRDLPIDLRKGRCYIPVDRLKELGLQPADLLQVSNESGFKPLYEHYLNLAQSHLIAGWNYTNTVPRNQVRVRLACAWPILIGVDTIRRMRAENILDANRRIKISRAEVRRIMVQTLVRYPLGSAWQRLGPTST